MYLKDENKLWIASGKERVFMIPKMANRHGLVAGATGTGKTVTIKVLAESFSDMGVPVFLADVKGDVSGMCRAGEPSPHVEERARSMGITDFSYSAYPVRFFDVYGKQGIPVRTTISAMGPLLIARLLGLNDTQTGVLQIIFKAAEDKGLPLVDLKDLRAMTQFAGDNAKELTTEYGNITAQSVGALQRGLLTLEAGGGEFFFGEPALDLNDWLGCDAAGRGFINLLDCVTLAQNPLLYSTFLLWMLSALYEMLPEAGDLEKPKMVFFFDEAHLLFNDAPKALLQKVEQVARLIRSKGVGIYFITQSPSDIPDNVLSQLGNKIQHALRAYTPKDQKAVKAAAASFRSNPEFDSETVLGELSTGEALVSMLDEKGAPAVVERAFILPPRSFFGVAAAEHREEMIAGCPLYPKYRTALARESAFEKLQGAAQEEQQKEAAAGARREKEKQQTRKTKPKASAKGGGTLGKTLKRALAKIGKSAGKALLRGFLGVFGLLGGAAGWLFRKIIGKKLLLLVVILGVIGGAGVYLMKHTTLLDGLIASGKIPMPAFLAEFIGIGTNEKTAAVVTANGLNLRAEASGNAAVVTTLKKGDTLTVTGESANGWTPVEFDGAKGWVGSQFIEIK